MMSVGKTIHTANLLQMPSVYHKPEIRCETYKCKSLRRKDEGFDGVLTGENMTN